MWGLGEQEILIVVGVLVAALVVWLVWSGGDVRVSGQVVVARAEYDDFDAKFYDTLQRAYGAKMTPGVGSYRLFDLDATFQRLVLVALGVALMPIGILLILAALIATPRQGLTLTLVRREDGVSIRYAGTLPRRRWKSIRVWLEGLRDASAP